MLMSVITLVLYIGVSASRIRMSVIAMEPGRVLLERTLQAIQYYPFFG